MALVNDLRRLGSPVMGTTSWSPNTSSLYSVVVKVRSGFGGTPPDDLTPFERERAVFYAKLPALLRTHAGKYVAISGGQIAAVGDSDNETARQFFRDHPSADVYIGFVGNEPPAYQIRPASR